MAQSHASYMKSLVSRQGEKQYLMPHHKPRDTQAKGPAAPGTCWSGAAHSGGSTGTFQKLESHKHQHTFAAWHPPPTTSHGHSSVTVLTVSIGKHSSKCFIFSIKIIWVDRGELAVEEGCAK